MPVVSAITDQQAVEQRLRLLVEEFLTELGGVHAARGFSWQSSLEGDLGLGSLERVELLSRLESEFVLRLSDAAMAEAQTVADLLRAVLTGDGRVWPHGFHTPVGPLAAVMETPRAAANLLEVLRHHALAHPERPHVYLPQEDGSEQTLTYCQLSQRAVEAAVELERGGVGAGDRVALMLPTGADFFTSFLGILLARAIPVPIYPPFRADRIEEFAVRQAAILRDAGCALLITNRRGEALGRLLRPAVPSLAQVWSAERLSDALGAGDSLRWPALPAGGESPALIQYTSGSTGNPKGVLLTHSNLLANIRAIGEALEFSSEDRAVSWLPLYHDMGLIGAWLMCLYAGAPITILSPLAFLSRPERWLWAIHCHRATLSVAPNFAYEMCARKIRDESIEGLDLSCWRASMNGSETVRPETIDRFTRRFAPYGFRPETMIPVYGLAESTVGLTFPPLNRAPRLDCIRRDLLEQRGEAEPAVASGRPAKKGETLSLVSVGRPLTGHQVRIVDEAGRPLGERRQGRVQFRGPSTMQGYFQQPEATAAIRCGDWLESGDLGYWADGELYITGRSKDIILKAGRNLYPQEIEAAAEEVEGIRKGCVIAFGLADPEQGTEKLVVAAETREQDPAALNRLAAQVGQRVLDALGAPADEVVLLGPGALPKTSSGKLRRTACRQAYEQGRLALPARSRAMQWLRLAAGWIPFAAGEVARRLARLAYAGYVYVLFFPLLLGCWLVMVATPSGRRSANLLRLAVRLFLRLAAVRIEVQGLENLGSGRAMLVANHASYADSLILIAVLPADVLFVAKRELLATPVLATFIRKIGHLTVEREKTAQSVADSERIGEALAGGRSVLVFPEGTFTRAKGLRPFRLGAFKAAAQAECPVVPVIIQGSRRVLPDECWTPRRGTIRVLLRPPIVPAGDDWHEIVRLRDLAFAGILADCGEPRLEILSASVPGAS